VHVYQGIELVTGPVRQLSANPLVTISLPRPAQALPFPSYLPPLPPFQVSSFLVLFFSFFPPSLFIIESLQLSPLPQICSRTFFFSTPLPCCCSILLIALKINSSIFRILFSLVLNPWLLLVLMVLYFFCFFCF
jgi:hypothetical protein